MTNIVICCDGTANEFAPDRTNVLKLYSALIQDAGQTAFYHPGIGTMEPDGAITDLGRKFRRTLGRAVGWGLEKDVAHAYAYIMETYKPGDRLYLFGFSRGAYTVRVLAALLSMYGLFAPGNSPLVPYAIRNLTSLGGADNEAFHEGIELAKEFKATFQHQPCPIHFLGVWDTVNSVGWISNPLIIPFSAYNPSVEHVRHAVSIDERRAFFRTNLFRRPTSVEKQTDIVEVWFPGVHCDVGGGYVESQSGLSKLALEWMMVEAREQGLALDLGKAASLLVEGSNSEKEDANAMLHESLSGWWWLAEIVPKKLRKGGWRVNRGRRRFIPDGAQIFEAAYLRRGYAAMLPATATRVPRKPLLSEVDG